MKLKVGSSLAPSCAADWRRVWKLPDSRKPCPPTTGVPEASLKESLERKEEELRQEKARSQWLEGELERLRQRQRDLAEQRTKPRWKMILSAAPRAPCSPWAVAAPLLLSLLAGG